MSAYADNLIIPQFPVHCPHGRQVGWALRNEPTVVTSKRFCSSCPECSQIDSEE